MAWGGLPVLLGAMGVGAFHPPAAAAGWVIAPPPDSAERGSLRENWVRSTDAAWDAPLPGHAFGWDDRHPVTQVSWHEARAYCEQFGYRLPTEAEWECAARAGSTGRYSWGETAQEGEGQVNLRDDAFSRSLFGRELGPFDDGAPFTAPVGSYAPNAWGFHDMAGNVWEWCEDHYLEEPYTSEARVDPLVRDATVTLRALRGGSWSNPPQRCRSSYRAKLDASHRAAHAGFRVAFTPGEEN